MPLDRNAELQRLAEADSHIGHAEQEIGRQIVRVERLRIEGHDTALAERTLRNFQRTLEEMKEHRKIIIRTIEEIDAGLV